MNNTIMIQGTASNVGKSLITTALCRIFARDGYRVAPFKAWNMALNSFVTPAGGEIGVAQAIQAEAAGIEPTVNMQPILVKPRGEGLSQVIIRGKPYQNMKSGEGSLEYLDLALGIIKDSLAGLRDEYDYVIMEGAGSPAEINVKDRDLANMKVAALNQSPVLLVADIGRGGAFASLVGTLSLLEPWEQELVQGFIINSFLGDNDLLKPGLEFLEEDTGKPVVGVIPYLKDIKLPEEDSVSLKKEEGTVEVEEYIKVGVINLPYISNFTDFAGLAKEPDVELGYINGDEELDLLDLIIIPGTKNTTADLKYLKESGLAGKILTLNKKGIQVIGICGGYQMMGHKLLDPYHTESCIDKINGLGLLPVETSFSPEKTTHQVKARIWGESEFLSRLKGEIIEGYEIHMGDTRFLSSSGASFPFKVIKRSGQTVEINDGAISDDGLSLGTYIHGIFNNDSFRRQLINYLRERKGYAPFSQAGYYYQNSLEEDYDRLAEIVRENLRMDYIYSLLE